MEGSAHSGYLKSMEQLVEVIQRLSLARDLATVMEIVRHAARNLTGADGATFVLKDGDKCFYADEDAISPLWKGQRFPMSICISGWVMNHRTPAMIEDIFNDPRVPANVYKPTFVKSLAMVPIRTIDPIGAIGNYWATPHIPTIEEIKLLQALADATAVTMENIRVYEELEKRVRQRTSELQAILDNVQVGIAFAVDGKIVQANPKTAEILGYPSPEILSQHLLPALLNCPNTEVSLFDEAKRNLSQGLVFKKETELFREDRSSFWAHLVVKSLDGEGAIWMLDDITSAKAKEKMLVDLKIAAEEATRLKSEFLASMSHELRTPLNAIIGFSEVLKDGLAGELQEKQFEYINDIFESALHLLSLINDVLDLSKIEAGKMVFEGELTDVTIIAQNSLSIIKEKALANQVRLKSSIPENLGEAWLDSRKCRQILYNLLSNAVKFTPAGGEVALSCRLIERTEAQRSANMASQVLPPFDQIQGKMFLEFSVTDTGIGISENDMARLFKPFVQIDSSLSRKFEGTGLGLALVRKLSELLGGAVALSSTQGKGSTFTVWIPYYNCMPESPPIESPPPLSIPPILPGKQPVVLIVEDDDRAADLLRVQIETFPCQVVRAKTAEEAISLLEETIPDLITVDILLPNMDGWDFLARLRTMGRFSHVPIVILSIMTDIDRGFSLGASEILQKPVSAQDITSTLERLGLFCSEPSGKRTRVLVVDDDPQAVDIVSMYLESANCNILRASNGREAVSMVREFLPDLLILDLMMPGMDGFEVVEEIKGDPNTLAIPIVILTAKTLTPADREQLNGHVLKILEKPRFNRDRFLGEVRRALGKKWKGSQWVE